MVAVAFFIDDRSYSSRTSPFGRLFLLLPPPDVTDLELDIIFGCFLIKSWRLLSLTPSSWERLESEFEERRGGTPPGLSWVKRDYSFFL